MFHNFVQIFIQLYMLCVSRTVKKKLQNKTRKIGYTICESLPQATEFTGTNTIVEEMLYIKQMLFLSDNYVKS